MHKCNSPVVVVCEGKSEETYLQELNRMMYRGEFFSASFVPVRAINGSFKNLKEAYKKACKENPRTEILIWADKDLFVRNDGNNQSMYEKKGGIPDFFFSVFNFEDFLMLHTPYLSQWRAEMQLRGHMISPLHEDEYLKVFREFYPNYKKGELPQKLTKAIVETMLRNNRDPANPFKNDFATYLENEIHSGKLKWFM